MIKVCVLALLALAVDGASALAGPNDFSWLTSTTVVPARSVELESRVTDQNDRGPRHQRATSWWLAPSIGLTSCVELRLPVELTWSSEVGSASNFRLSRFGTEARYRLARSGGDHPPVLAPLVRLALSRDVTIRNLAHAEIDVVASYQVGTLLFAVDGGVTAEANRGGVHFELRPGAGASVRVNPDMRLGAEVYAELSLDSAATSWAVVGPNLAWTHGRAWFTASFGIGIHGISTAGRLVWGVAL